MKARVHAIDDLAKGAHRMRWIGHGAELAQYLLERAIREASRNSYLFLAPSQFIMGKKGKKALAGKPKKLTPKDVGKRLDVLVKKLGEELEGADLFAPVPPKEDCAVCLVPLPYLNTEKHYKACCGN